MMEGNARRLPAWIVGGKASVPDSNVVNEEKKSRKVRKDQTEVDGNVSRARRRKRGTALRHRDHDNGGDDQFDDDDNGDGSGGGDDGVQTMKKKNKKCERMSNGVAMKRSMKLSAGGSVSGDCAGKEEDVEFTVEDLVSIAEEYVKAEEGAKKEQQLQKECESHIVFPMALSPRNASEASALVPDNKPKTTGSFSAAENLASEQSLLNATVSTGDAAQDMLNLFLGPLLKKPVEDQKTNFVVKDLDFGFESVRQSQNDVGENIDVPVKKRGSFKDKVSSLLH